MILSDFKLGVIGLGLMGSSAALGLRKHCTTIYGVDKSPQTLAMAFKKGIIDRGETRLTTDLRESDVILLAVPVKTILAIIPELPRFISKKALIMDFGSTKRDIVKAYNQLLPAHRKIGGHPMCGKASGGILNAEANLFTHAPFALVKTENSPNKSCQQAEDIVKALGASPFWIDAENHDAMTAATSHLPYLISCALVQSTPISCGQLIGPGYRSASRLASTPLSMMGDIIETNHDNILKQLDAILVELQSFRTLLEQKAFEKLNHTLMGIRKKQEKLYEISERIRSNEN